MNVNKTVVVLLLLLTYNYSFTQQSQFAFNFRSGISIPIGEYAYRSLENGCFTTPGINIASEMSYPVYSQIHVVLQGGVQFHPVDVAALGYAKVVDDPFLSNVYIRSEAYRVIHITAGVGYKHSISDKLNASGKLLAGLFYSQTPYQVYRPEYFLMGPEYYVITSARDRSFSYGGGIDLGYQINHCVLLQLGSDLLFSKAAFGFISAGSSRVDWREIGFMNIYLGINLLF